MEGNEGVFRLDAENAVHRRDFGNGGVILGDAVQLHLNHHHIGTDAAPPQRDARVGGGVVLYGRVGDDLHIPIVGTEDFHGVVALLGKILAAPLAESFAGDGGAVAEFGGQRLHKARPAQIAVKQVIHQPCHIGKEAAALYKKLIVGRGAGNVKIIAPAAVELRIYPVQGKGHNGQDVCPQGAFLPGGVNLRGGHVFHIVRETDGHILRIRAGCAQMYGDPLGYIGNDSRHTSSYRFWGGVL